MTDNLNRRRPRGVRRDPGAGVQLDRVRAAGAVPGRPQRGLPQVPPRQAQSKVLLSLICI